MREYLNPEMKIASFDKEAVATTASAALAEWQETSVDGVTKYNATVDFNKMSAVSVEF